MAERRLGVAERLARYFPDQRDHVRITRADMIRARVFAISCGYEDAVQLTSKTPERDSARLICALTRAR
jgi:hypothetical protein